MRLRRLVIPLALLTPLALASPASAFDWGVEAVDFEFKPAERRIALGDTVTWSFAIAGHTSVSVGGQADSWKSIEEGTNPAGTHYSHTFSTPGRFQYVCTPHKAFMKGTVEVGTDAVVDTVENFKSKRRGRNVTLSFELMEAATMSYRLRGPSPRTVKRPRMEAGRHSFRLRRLKRGKYRGTLTLTDDFDKKTTPKNFFVIR